MHIFSQLDVWVLLFFDFYVQYVSTEFSSAFATDDLITAV